MPYSHRDVIDFNEGVSGNPDVLANSAARHNRLHAMLSTADHTDVSATPTPQDRDALVWDAAAERWKAGAVGGVTTADVFLLMGG